MSVMLDVKIGDAVAIKAGTPVIGRILKAVPEKNLGRSGKLDFSIDAIQMPDGTTIPLRYSLEKNKGRSSVGEGVIFFGLAGFLGLAVLHGHEATLYEGAAYDVFTDSVFVASPESLSPRKPPSGTDPFPKDAPTIGVVYLWEPGSHTLRPLPDDPWGARPRSDSGTIEIAGDRSGIRTANPNPTFVYRIGYPGNVHLYALAVDRKDKKGLKRWFSQVHAVGNTKETSPGLPVSIRKSGRSSYELTPKHPLEPGEYAVLLSGSKVFSFGIDPQ
jgi:hypothetical protein